MNLLDQYAAVRARTERICGPLKTEDYVVQPVADVSPPKWHLGHATWFFETFALKPYLEEYREFDPNYNFVFNSYYETIGARVVRTDRGNLSRPSVDDVFKYRRHVDNAMEKLLKRDMPNDLRDTVILGLNHEQQHQELLTADIKYILGHNPLMPPYHVKHAKKSYCQIRAANTFLEIPAGIFEIGYTGDGFCYDNELGRHKVYLQDYKIAQRLVTNGEFLEFINDGGYENHMLWHAEGLDWVKSNRTKSPMYWHNINGAWHNYTLDGFAELEMAATLCHISFYEAAAYATWKGMRLPTEFEWEVAADLLGWGERWEWTNSAYLPYPGFKKAEGAMGEYNGKFMINQMALRGASEVTPPGHSRGTYRNFFHPHLRWQYSGIRLAE